MGLLTAELEKLFELAILDADSEESIEQLMLLRTGNDSILLPTELTAEGVDEGRAEQSFYLFLQSCTIPQKIKLALYGNRTARTLLVRDTMRQIPLFVLQNPGLTDGEVGEFARNTNLDDSVFRAISNNPNWMKGYATKVSLVSNPKVPADVSLKWVKHLQDRDLRRLSKSKNIPQVVASQCRKLVDERSSS